MAPITTTPWVADVDEVTVREVPASLPNTVVPVRLVPAATVAESLVETGLTAIVTIAVAVCPVASVVVYVKVSGPE